MDRNIDLERMFEDEGHISASFRHSDEIAVLSVDPGVTTGLSIMTASLNRDSRMYEVGGWGSHQMSYGGSGNRSDRSGVDPRFPEQDIAGRIAEVFLNLAEQGTAALVIEDFIIRKMNTTRDFLAPVRVTAGIVQAVYKENPKLMSNIFYQTPADAKSVCTDERMDRWGFKIASQNDRHSRDADRHGILFLRRCSEKPRETVGSLSRI